MGRPADAIRRERRRTTRLARRLAICWARRPGPTRRAVVRAVAITALIEATRTLDWKTIELMVFMISGNIEPLKEKGAQAGPLFT